MGKCNYLPNYGDLLAAWLAENGYDGLFCPNDDCACQLSDLFPCGEFGDDCEAGYKEPCPDGCGEHEFHILRDKPGPVGHEECDELNGGR